MSLTKSIFKSVIRSVEESYVELHEMKLDGNKTENILPIDEDSNVLSARNLSSKLNLQKRKVHC